MIKYLLPFFFFIHLFAAEPPDENTLKAKNFEEEATNWNLELRNLRDLLQKKYQELLSLYEKGESESELSSRLKEIDEIKKKVHFIQGEWKKKYQDSERKEDSDYAFWDQGDTTLAQLVMEYGGSDFLYVIPSELGSMKIHLYSGIPIPQDSWEEMIEVILSYYGIGVKKISPFVRQLYLVKHRLTAVDAICESTQVLKLLPSHATVMYLFSPPPHQLKFIQSFFERFADLNQVTVQVIGSKVVLIATRETIEKLLSIHKALLQESENKVIRTHHFSKVSSKEALPILEAYFSDPLVKSKPNFYFLPKDELIFLPYQPSSIVLIGPSALVEQAEKILKELEAQTADPKEMTVYWYTCKHSKPEDVAEVLNHVYTSLGYLPDAKQTFPNFEEIKRNEPSLPVAPEKVEPGRISENKNIKGSQNFIVDSKTNSILMVVRREDVEKIESLLKKLDVPKKMVQIDVLLVERKMHDRKQTGINILKMGNGSSNENKVGLSFSSLPNAANRGILDFMLSRKEDKYLPSIDLTLGFLLAQNDLQITANPSVLAINQTPASISIVEELSINNGAVPVETSHGHSFEKSFTRAQFGIIIVMTPTIHLVEEENEKGFINLETDVTFDTAQSLDNDRPPVTRRRIKNEVRIKDGETIILGGLRRKSKNDDQEKLPFFGEIPGIGKIFGTTKLDDSSTEMFIFITPHILKDSEEGAKKQRLEWLKQRPGDIPEFYKKIQEGLTEEKRKIFEKSIDLLIGN